jgi:hypothetical protein
MRSLSFLAWIVLLAGCGSHGDIATTASDVDAAPLEVLIAGDSPLREVALAADTYLRSKGEDPRQYLLLREPQSQNGAVLYAIYHRDVFPISTIGNPGHGSRYLEYEPSQRKVVREWGMQ